MRLPWGITLVFYCTLRSSAIVCSLRSVRRLLQTLYDHVCIITCACCQESLHPRALAFRYSPRTLSEFILHKWAETEHKKFDYFNSTATAEEHGAADEDADLQGAVHEDAAAPSSDDDADVLSVDTDGSEGGDGAAHQARDDEFNQFFGRTTCVGHTCSSGARACN